MRGKMTKNVMSEMAMKKVVVYVNSRMKVIRGWSKSDLLLNVEFVAQFSREKNSISVSPLER